MKSLKISAYVMFIGVVFLFGGSHTIAEAPAEAEEIERPVLHQALRPICGCESGGGPNNPPKQFEPDGVTVRLGRVNPNDVGACQINTEPRNGHVYMAPKLGFDLWTEDGNIAYANWLYEQEGLTPWNSSKSCWGN